MMRLFLSWLLGWRVTPYTPPVVVEGMAWCGACRGWQVFDVIPAVRSAGIPAFSICCFCGGLLDLEEVAS